MLRNGMMALLVAMVPIQGFAQTSDGGDNKKDALAENYFDFSNLVPSRKHSIKDKGLARCL